MGAANGSLDDLRRRIDAVDDQIHDLIMERAAIVQSVAASKPASELRAAYLRPGREARILRRLAARHRGAFPEGGLVRIWREMLCCFLPVQGPYAVAVGGGDLGLWDTARDFFGSDTQMTAEAGPDAAIAAVAEGRATVAVLPMPAREDPWWRALIALGPARPPVVFRLPFAAMQARAAPSAPALVVAATRPEESGEDVTLIAVETDEAIEAALGAAGLEAGPVWSWPGLRVAEIAGFVAEDDPRVEALSRATGAPCHRLGAYPVPLTSDCAALP